MTMLPDGWMGTTLGDCTTTIRNGIFARRPNDEGLGTQILRISAVRNGRVDVSEPRFVEDVTEEQVRAFGVASGDILVTRYNGSRHLVGIPGLVPEHTSPLLHPDKLIRVVIDTSFVDERFVNYQLQAPQTRKFLEPRIRTTAGQSGIAGRDVRDIPLVLPRLDEQRRIVEILEDHLSRLDAASGAIVRQIDSVGLLRLSRVQEVRSHAIELGADLRRVGDIATTALGKMLDAKRVAGVPTPYLRNINVRWGSVDTSDVFDVPLTDQERSRFELRRGDVLVCEGGEPGRCAVWEGSSSLMTYQKALHRVRANPDLIDPHFLALMLEHFIRSGRGDPLFTGTTIKHLPQEKLRIIELPVPPLEDQRRVVAESASFDVSVQRLKDGLMAANRRADALRCSLLTAAFSGKLSGTVADTERVEEMASV
ncbi:restriction endonuclease subunit S [Pseudactinotalea terrae]|uniref:restriction endonuclease subunit S n=1 Tax=Pseudactinotalea terrae TaxID=1743262 RepID=UPI0012E28A01|nr:restriction endonuclease subunit S [Pseudactinotalea terrae]